MALFMHSYLQNTRACHVTKKKIEKVILVEFIVFKKNLRDSMIVIAKSEM